MGLFDFFRRKPDRDHRAVRELTKRFARFQRSAWLPVTKPGDSGPMGSKFGGTALIPSGETWPVCGGCNKPMQLFLQLDSRSLPDAADKPFGDGFLQAFYCTNREPHCEDDHSAWGPFAKSTLVRVLGHETQPDGAVTDSPVENGFAEKTITGWTEKEDFPDEETLEAVSHNLSEEMSYVWLESDFPLVGDKLLGWPHWLQGMEFPTCPECDHPMQVIFQIDSNTNLPYDFGDVGVAHITICKNHPRILTIQWSCT